MVPFGAAIDGCRRKMMSRATDTGDTAAWWRSMSKGNGWCRLVRGVGEFADVILKIAYLTETIKLRDKSPSSKRTQGFTNYQPFFVGLFPVSTTKGKVGYLA